jgi:hypothetical protein
MPNNVEPLAWFISLFQGNKLFYTLHQLPFTEQEDGKVKAAWCGFAKYGSKSFPKVPAGAEKGDFIPVTEAQYRDHLNGKAGLALAPVMDAADKRNVCLYGAVDIDVRGVDYAWLIRKLYDLGFKFVPFRSKSGGVHFYFFFQEAEPADQVIAVLKRFVEVLALDKLYTAKAVEIFPKQSAVIPGDKNANGLLLPFFNIANPEECPNRMYAPDGKLLGIRNAKPVVDELFTSLRALEHTIDGLPYSDAPYCIQALLLTGALFKEGDHRNDFLFTAALYLKLKEKDGFLPALEAMNSRLECPLDKDSVDSIYDSVTRKDYQIWGQCKKPPCADYCSRTLCKKRVYGIGKDKGNAVSDIEFGRAVRVMTEEPYYLLEVRVAGTEKYAQVRIDCGADLMNQRVMQQACIRYLKYVPIGVKQAVWTERLNREVLEKMEDQAVPQTTDMTKDAYLRKHFLRFLTHSQAPNRAPYMVVMGHVYYTDGTYFFSGDGFQSYLEAMNCRTEDKNLRAALENFGCEMGTVKYTVKNGEERSLDCWKKAEDEAVREMRVFYEEIYGEEDKRIGGVVITQDGEGDSDGEGGGDGDDGRF